MIESQSIPASLTREEFYPRAAAYMMQTQPEFELEATEVFFSLVFAYEAIASHFTRRFHRYGLTFPGFNMLMILNHPIYRETGCPLSQLGELLLVSKANVTGVMDSLEKRGLAERIDASYDRRVKLAMITGQGKELIGTMLPGHFRAVRQVAGGVSKGEKGQLRDLLRKLRRAVLDAVEGPDDEG